MIKSLTLISQIRSGSIAFDKLMKFLQIAQTPSPNTQTIAQSSFDAMQSYCEAPAAFITKCPSQIIATDLKDIDGLVLGTLENIGALAGLTKDMFDRCYNDWLTYPEALPVAIYIRAGLDGRATKRSLTAIAQALKWKLIAPPIILHGAYEEAMCTQAAELSGALTAGVESGIF